MEEGEDSKYCVVVVNVLLYAGVPYKGQKGLSKHRIGWLGWLGGRKGVV